MLAKVSNSTVSGKKEQKNTKAADSTSVTVNGNETTVVSNFSVTNLIQYKFKANSISIGGSSSGQRFYIYFYENGTKKYTSTFYPPYTGTLNNIETDTFNSNGTSIMVKALNSIGRNGNINNGVLEYTTLSNVNITKTIFTHKALPRELKTIGNKATATLFGMHTDYTRYTGE